MNTRPTAQYLDLQKAYDIMNGALFQAELPDVMITLATRTRNTLGYYRALGFQSRSTDGEFVGEICLNPASFHQRTDIQILSTLLHEMTHVWQFYFGKPSRAGYHNKEWGKAMKNVGLHPSETGALGGKQTGQSMSHYVIEGGAFAQLVTKLQGQQIRIDWQTPLIDVPSAPPTTPATPPSTRKTPAKGVKTKYTCPTCQINVWGKGGLNLACLTCDKPLFVN